MRDHTVDIERSRQPGGAAPRPLRFAPVFNVAVPFIDRHLAEGRAGKVAIRTVGGEEVTYGALARRVNRCGNALLRLGLERGERVLMMVKDCPEFFYLFWGAIKAGLVPVPVNTLLRRADYRFMIEDSGATLVVYSPEFAGEVEPALAEACPSPRHLLRTEGMGDTLKTLLAAAAPELASAPARAEDDCFWLYSSGSTGAPKGAVHLHRDMVATSQHYGVETLGIDAGDVCFSAAKLFFAYGLGNSMTFPLWVGASAVLADARPSPASTLEVMAKFHPTLYFGVPTLYSHQLRVLEEGQADLSSLRLFVSAGEALPADILRRWREVTGKPILDGIGSTEALHIFISNRPGDVKPGASGRVVAGYEARIVDEAGREAKDGDTGALMIRGPSIAKYYWNNPERTRRTMVDGWLVTGDTYYRDAAGYYYFCGRSDDMLKVGGMWCSPFEIEARLIEHPQVLEAAVIGRPDAEGLVKPEAYVVLKDPAAAGEALAKELVEHCKGGLAPYKFPRRIEFLAELPKTATGKIQRFKLRAEPA
ncbi:MAG: benzoate-CoA ligase family protein [Pseudomonadota bacterium]